MHNNLIYIEFEKYSNLLLKMSSDIAGLVIIDIHKDVVWQSSSIDANVVESLLKQLSQETDVFCKKQDIQLSSIDHSACSYPLAGAYNDDLGVLIGIHRSKRNSLINNKNTDQESYLYDVLESIANCIVSELSLHSELNTMALDLGERNEQINLMFSSDESSVQHFDNSNSMKQLISNCIDFMNIKAAMLIFPTKKTTYKQHSDESISDDIDVLSQELATTIVDITNNKNQPLVFNQKEDLASLGLTENHGIKIISAPIYDANKDMCGCLIVTKEYSEIDFTNNERNLILVMATRAGKIFQSSYDKLTGLFTRSNFEYILDSKTSKSASETFNHCLVIVNIEQLNITNDLYGFDAGDTVIQNFASKLEQYINESTLIARLSGDEFGIFISDCTAEQAKHIIFTFQTTLKNEPVIWQEHEIQLAFRGGIVPILHASSARHLLSSADSVINLAKHNGHHSIEIFKQDDETILERKKHILWANNIQKGLRDDKFRLVCQGIFDCNNTSKKHHFEVLIRMLDDSGNFISPFHFLPAAESFHLMPELDRWVVQRTFHLLNPYKDLIKSEGLSWAINISGQSISNAEFRNFLLHALKNCEFPTTCISFEVTESSTIDNINQARILIEEVKTFGCSIYLDDFGTGLSSFSYMQALPFDYIKIDGCFIKKIHTDSVSLAMVKAICDVVKAMNLKSVAEFVEYDEDVTLLKEIGVDLLQGYLLHQPEDMKQVLANIFPNQINKKLLSSNSNLKYSEVIR